MATGVEDIAVSIVLYQTDTEELSLCLGDLEACGVRQVYLIDNSPTDKLKSIAKKYRHIVAEYIHMEKNVGYGAAHNVALRKSMSLRREYHLVLNSDIRIPSADALQRIVAFMDENPQVGQLTPRMEYPDGSLQYNVRMLPTPMNLILRRFFPKWIGQKKDTLYQLAFWNHLSSANVPYHQGSFMFLRVSALYKVGLFDERFFMYPEDIDLTRRIHRVCETLYWPEVTVVHAHKAASYKNGRMMRIHAWNMIKYFCKWGWIFDSERKRFNRQLLASLQQK